MKRKEHAVITQILDYTWHIIGKVAIINNLGTRISSYNERACDIYDGHNAITGCSLICVNHPQEELAKTKIYEPPGITESGNKTVAQT